MFNGVANYKDGRLTMNWHYAKDMRERELFYLHLQKRSMRVETERKDQFSVVPNRFIPLQDSWDRDSIDRVAPRKAFYPEYWKHRARYIWGKIAKTNSPEFYNWGIK